MESASNLSIDTDGSRILSGRSVYLVVLRTPDAVFGHEVQVVDHSPFHRLKVSTQTNALPDYKRINLIKELNGIFMRQRLDDPIRVTVYSSESSPALTCHGYLNPA